MAQWQDLRNYIFANYKVTEDNGNILLLLFSLSNERSQMVVVARHTLGGGTEDWVVVESPIAKHEEVDITRALNLVGDMVCGGLVMTGDYLVMRDAFPLENLDANEFERPLRLVTSSADELEEMLVARDEL